MVVSLADRLWSINDTEHQGTPIDKDTAAWRKEEIASLQVRNNHQPGCQADEFVANHRQPKSYPYCLR